MNNIQKAIRFLIQTRDIQYMQAINASNSADLCPKYKTDFAPGSLIYQTLRKNKKSAIACNIVSYNQIEGHINAAIKQNSAIIFEVARSQLEYALNETKIFEYTKEVMQKTNCTLPIVLHGDHIQYSQKLFDQKAILKSVYEEINHETFTEEIDIESIDDKIINEVSLRLENNSQNERTQIIEIIKKLITAGFSSIAIDASTIYDDFAGEEIIKYYSEKGTPAEKLIIKLEEEFALSLEWGVNILKYDIEEDINKYHEIKEDIISEMKKRNKEEDKIQSRINEFERSFGILASEAKKNNIKKEDIFSAYEKISTEIQKATICGEIKKEVLDNIGPKKQKLLLKTSNAAETTYQILNIKKILSETNSLMLDNFGIEVEVGHVDRKIPNPRLNGKIESKVTHPIAVKVFGEYLSQQNVKFDLIATNNGSGHGTEFDKTTLTPISQVDKISPYLTHELQIEARKFSASIAQHGTSGSDMDELAELARKEVVKFNIATNYQQIILNVLSLVDQGQNADQLFDTILSNQNELICGLSEETRNNIKLNSKMLSQNINVDPNNNDSLFKLLMKKTYAWGKTKGKISEQSSQEDIATVLAKEFKRIFGELGQELYQLGSNHKDFQICQNLKTYPEDDICSLTSGITSIKLVQEGYRGKARNLDPNFPDQKMQISQIKDESDARAKNIYDSIIKNSNTILVIAASEGFGRDGVAESFKASDIITPQIISNEINEIKNSVNEKKDLYTASDGKTYTIEYAIIDVIENTNSFVTNADNKKLIDIKNDEAGASSIIVTGQGIKSIGNYPDYYADGIFTLVPPNKKQEFTDNPLDPESTASNPENIELILKRIATANDIRIENLEIVVMDRNREEERIKIIRNLQDKYPGLELTLIKDGTVAHTIQASIGRINGNHKIIMTVGATPETFYNLSLANLFKEKGSIASVRIYSKNVNLTKDNQKSNNLSRRYDFDKDEQEKIRELRPEDAKDILNGQKIFTQNDINGDVRGCFAFITNNGVFGISGVNQLPQNHYEVSLLRFAKINNEPYAWLEKKLIKVD